MSGPNAPESGNHQFDPLTVAAIRDRCWDHGWRPMPVLSWDHPDPIIAGKAPLGKDWGKRARQNPPECIKLGAVVKHAWNTGILCDGLRLIDIDVDDTEKAGAVRKLAVETLGDTIGRYRDNSARSALAYRAADGSPAHREITGAAHTTEFSCRVEVLGHGQQFVAHGVHKSGVPIWWSPAGPDQTAVDDLPAVTEDAITAFLKAAALLIGADPEQVEQRTNGHDHQAGEPQADPLRIAAALLDIPNHGPADWEAWNKVGMAVWRATGGSDMGWAALDAWSRRNRAYDAEQTRARWDHYFTSPPTQIGAGTIFHMAAEARRARANGPDHAPPDEDPRPDVPPDYGPTPHSRLPPWLSLAEFMATYETPDYVVDGILQRGRLYALTSPTSHGKTAVAQLIGIHVAANRNLGNIEVTGGPIIFLAGENPSDLCVRMHAACQYHGLNPTNVPLLVMPGNFPLTPEAAEELKNTIDAEGVNPAGIIFDTAASFFPGDNDNDNVQKGAYGRNLRVLTTCQGRPFVLVPTHPVKHPDRDNLLPAGGGAFLNELDGNLTLWGEPVGEIATMHWQGKFRGADFQPVTFALQQVKIAGLMDARGRPVVSIIATLQTYDQAEAAARTARSDEDTVLELLRRHPGISIRAVCTEASWLSPAGSPLISKVQRLIKSLKADKLVALHRGKYRLTEAGKKEVSAE
jgi:hypothetical protein